MIVLRIGLGVFFKKSVNLKNFAAFWERVRFNRKITKLKYQSCKISAPSFKNLPGKLLMLRGLDEFEPFKMFKIL